MSVEVQPQAQPSRLKTPAGQSISKALRLASREAGVHQHNPLAE